MANHRVTINLNTTLLILRHLSDWLTEKACAKIFNVERCPHLRESKLELYLVEWPWLSIMTKSGFVLESIKLTKDSYYNLLNLWKSVQKMIAQNRVPVDTSADVIFWSSYDFTSIWQQLILFYKTDWQREILRYKTTQLFRWYTERVFSTWCRYVVFLGTLFLSTF